MIKKEKSCGIIVFKKEFKNAYILLVHHNLGHWSVPRGHMEGKETEEETAKREVLEEAGIQAKIMEGFREKITYFPKSDILKDVIFFIGRAENDKTKPQLSEVSEAKWIELKEALDFITYPNEKEVIEKAICYIKENQI